MDEIVAQVLGPSPSDPPIETESLKVVLSCPDPVGLTRHLRGLAKECEKSGDVRGSIRILRLIAAICRALRAPDHPALADALEELAKALCAAGEFETARPLC